MKFDEGDTGWGPNGTCVGMDDGAPVGDESTMSARPCASASWKPAACNSVLMRLAMDADTIASSSCFGLASLACTWNETATPSPVASAVIVVSFTSAVVMSGSAAAKT